MVGGQIRAVYEDVDRRVSTRRGRRGGGKIILTIPITSRTRAGAGPHPSGSTGWRLSGTVAACRLPTSSGILRKEPAMSDEPSSRPVLVGCRRDVARRLWRVCWLLLLPLLSRFAFTEPASAASPNVVVPKPSATAQRLIGD